MTAEDSAKMTVGLIAMAIIIAGMIGWARNAYLLINCDFEPSYKAEAIRGIGIFVPPVGAIAGYMDIGQ